MTLTLLRELSLADVPEPRRHVSLVVTYDTDTRTFRVDDERTDEKFPHGCVTNLDDDDVEVGPEALDLAEEVITRLGIALRHAH